MNYATLAAVARRIGGMRIRESLWPVVRVLDVVCAAAVLACLGWAFVRPGPGPVLALLVVGVVAVPLAVIHYLVRPRPPQP